MKLKKEEAQEYRAMCYHCYRPKKACFCSLVRPFSTNTEFRILMHPKEAKLAHIGTGRMTNYALSNSHIIIGENFDHCEQVQKILRDQSYYPVVLYPGEDSLNISEAKKPLEIPEEQKLLIFIIDGTWPCAKSMFRDSLTLHSLPKISFNVDIESRYVIRHQPAKFCLSTIESTVILLNELERLEMENLKGRQDGLISMLDALVAFQKKCAEDPSLESYKRGRKKYTLPSERKAAKRWDHRKICFEEKNYN